MPKEFESPHELAARIIAEAVEKDTQAQLAAREQSQPTVEPDEADDQVGDWALEEINLVGAALAAHDDGDFHREYLRGAADMQGLIDGTSGEYAQSVMQGIIGNMRDREHYINSPEDAAAFVEQEVARLTDTLADHRLSPQSMHLPMSDIGAAMTADDEMLRTGDDLFSDERAMRAGESFKATLAQLSGASVPEIEEAGRQAAEDDLENAISRSLGPDDPSYAANAKASDKDSSHGSDVNQWGRTPDQEKAILDDFDADMQELTTMHGADAQPENALADHGPDESYLEALARDAARANRSEFPPEMIASRQREAERWHGMKLGSE